MAGPPGLNLRGRRSRAVPVSTSTPDIGRAARVLHGGGNACVVVAVAVARESLRFEQLSFMIRDLCTTHAWVRVALNLFDVGNSSEAGTSRQHASAASYGLHRCVTVSTIVGFKTRFWQQSLTPNRVQATHLFLIDSDMDFRPAVFDLLTFVRLSAAANVSILSPTPYGDGNGGGPPRP